MVADIWQICDRNQRPLNLIFILCSRNSFTSKRKGKLKRLLKGKMISFLPKLPPKCGRKDKKKNK